MKHHVFYGDDLAGIELPPDVEIFDAPPAIEPAGNEDDAIRHAIENPVGIEPLETLLKPGMKITVAFDDACIPIPPMADDVRRRVIDVVIELAVKCGIKNEDIKFICANGTHRKWTGRELEHLIGGRAYGENVACHDAEAPGEMVYIGKTEDGHDVDVNKCVIDSDLVIYVNVNWVSMNGGWKSVVVGLGSVRSINEHHNIDVLRKSGSLMQPETSVMHKIINNMGMLIKSKARVFQIETVLNNDLWGPYRDVIHPVMRAARILPQFVKGALKNYMRSYYKLIGINAGSPELVHNLTLGTLYKQQNTKISQQADVVIVGVPNLSPYSVFSDINPVLFYNLLLGYIFNMYHNRPLLKKGGVLVAINPVHNRFNRRHHPSYLDFFNRILPELKKYSAKEVEDKYAMEYARNEVYVRKYRLEFAYHGIHPFYTYAIGRVNMDYIGMVIIVGASDERVVEMLGFDHSPDVKTALNKAGKFLGVKGTRALINIPPIFVSEVGK